jgi:putative peptide zinc metalloprotease protein
MTSSINITESKQDPLLIKLPPLRQDLNISRGPDEEDGTPTYNVYDPIQGQYFKISWVEFPILENLRPDITLRDLLRILKMKTTVDYNAEEVFAFLQDLDRHHLLAKYRSSEEVLHEKLMAKVNPITWLVFHYLYIRIPVVNPDAFLARTLPYAKIFISKPAVLLYFFVTIAGFSHLISRFDEFTHTITYFFNIEGLFFYALAVTFVKILHELAHAYVAKLCGVRVPSIGIAFIVLWPVLYTDITDSWKLANRKQRLAISFAGVALELVVAGLATLCWSVTNPGVLQSVFFVLASASWITTLAINLNPCMRFDGYYLLCDLLGIDNLQMRSFDLSAWAIRKWIFGVDVPPPEEVSSRTMTYMIIYAVATWMYRLFLYTAIAVLVYYKFTKLLGIILFLIEIVVFITWPIWYEVKELYKVRDKILVTRKNIIPASLLIIFLIWAIIPLPHTLQFASITIPVEYQLLWAPEEAIVKKIYIKQGDTVHKGDVLYVLSSEKLEENLLGKKADIEILNRTIQILINSGENSIIPEKQQELQSSIAMYKGLNEAKEQLTVRAELSGMIYFWDELVSIGQSVSKNQLLGKLGNLSSIGVGCYVPEKEVSYLRYNEEVTFSRKHYNESLHGKIIRIHPARAQYLTQFPLASLYKGELPVTSPRQEAKNEFPLAESYYYVEVALDNDGHLLRLDEPGTVYAKGPWRSKLLSLIEYLTFIGIRESGF